MRISDWSSDVCSSDLALAAPLPRPALRLEIDDDVQVTDPGVAEAILRLVQEALTNSARHADADVVHVRLARDGEAITARIEDDGRLRGAIREGNGLAGMRERIDALHGERSEEHTSELQSLMRTSYAVFGLKTKKKTHTY